jgi:hypothetical protein
MMIIEFNVESIDTKTITKTLMAIDKEIARIKNKSCEKWIYDTARIVIKKSPRGWCECEITTITNQLIIGDNRKGITVESGWRLDYIG